MKTSSRRIPTDHAAFAVSFLFYYRRNWENGREPRTWDLDGCKVHVIVCESSTNYNTQHDIASGFAEMKDGTIRFFTAVFTANYKVQYWHSFETTDMQRDAARRKYARLKDNATWTRTVTA